MGMQDRRQVVRGPLAPYASGFEEELERRGYSCSAVRLRLWLLDHVSRWLDERGLAAADLTPQRVEQFLADRRGKGYKSWVSPRSMILPVEYLRSVGVLAEPVVVPNGELGRLMEEYGCYLAFGRGLAPTTVDAYLSDAEMFLLAVAGSEPFDLEGLTSTEVLAFVKDECARRPVPSARHLLVSVRSLLRYLHLSGAIPSPLAAVVPAIARRRQFLPRAVAAEEVSRLLASCDRSRPVGLRDYAILVFLARLGLRAGEVAALRLDDFDWRQGEVLVRGKGDRHERMPLPVDVGEAVVGYLQHGRPRCDQRNVFLRVRAPRSGLGPRGVAAVVHDACIRAGLPPMRSHRLRHTAATSMLRAGSPLPEVAAVLRHHRLASSTIYAKVDQATLLSLARPWPGSEA